MGRRIVIAALRKSPAGSFSDGPRLHWKFSPGRIRDQKRAVHTWFFEALIRTPRLAFIGSLEVGLAVRHAPNA